MDVIIEKSQTTDRVDKYFKAWNFYDIGLLKEIFSVNARYVIRKKKIYRGIDQIIEYWKKNQKRQKDLQLHWKVIKRTARCDVVEFGAYFYDISEKLYNKINGTIIFKYDANEKIKVLTEAYRKRVR